MVNIAIIVFGILGGLSFIVGAGYAMRKNAQDKRGALAHVELGTARNHHARHGGQTTKGVKPQAASTRTEIALHKIAMAFTLASSPLEEVLSDIEDILELRMSLCMRWATSDHQPFISVDWMDGQLQEKIDEVGRRVSTPPTRRSKCMSRMLKIQDDLCMAQFRDLPHEMALVIAQLKLTIDNAPESPPGYDRWTDPLFSRPFPNPTAENINRGRHIVPADDHVGIEFLLSAYGSETRKAFGDDKDLRLVWKEDQKVFHCYKGRYNQATVYANLELVPDRVERFIRSKDGNKVLVESSVDGESGVPLFLQLKDRRDAKRLLIMLLELTEGHIEHQIRRRGDLDRSVAEYE
ncbi:MAG: hypothetical protein Q9173_005344 [Seirophora scorigena]